jgi:hypothetical protein
MLTFQRPDRHVTTGRHLQRWALMRWQWWFGFTTRARHAKSARGRPPLSYRAWLTTPLAHPPP